MKFKIGDKDLAVNMGGFIHRNVYVNQLYDFEKTYGKYEFTDFFGSRKVKGYVTHPNAKDDVIEEYEIQSYYLLVKFNNNKIGIFRNRYDHYSSIDSSIDYIFIRWLDPLELMLNCFNFNDKTYKYNFDKVKDSYGHYYNKFKCEELREEMTI